MAGDWIKVEKTTLDKPEMIAIARLCGVTIEQAFAAWFRFYSWADAQTADGFVRFLSASDADRIGTICGLGSALEKVGWLRFDESGCFFNNWDRHNGDSSKRRALDSARKIRKRSAECPQNVRTETGQNADQRREEKSINNTHTAHASVIPTVQEVWQYAESICYSIDAQKFVDHYASTGWRGSNGQPITDWQALVRRWKVRDEEKQALPKKPSSAGYDPNDGIQRALAEHKRRMADGKN